MKINSDGQTVASTDLLVPEIVKLIGTKNKRVKYDRIRLSLVFRFERLIMYTTG